MKYHIQQGGTRLPAATLEELMRMSQEGKLLADAEYWHAGMPDWRPLNELMPGLTPPPSGPRLLTPPVRKSAKRPAYQEDETSGFLQRFNRALLRVVWVFSCVSIFLPIVAVSVPIAGSLEFSMFDLISGQNSPIGGESSQPTPEMAEIFKVPDSGTTGANKGMILCGIALLGLAGHYLLTVVWGIVEFVAQSPTRRFDAFWLLLAAQYPLVMLIGGKMLVKGLVEEAAGDPGKPKGSFEGLAILLTNHISVTPAMAAWGLFAAALIHVVLSASVKEARP